MATTSGTLISYLHLCHRKLWLHANDIRMEHTNNAVAEGKLLNDTTYARRPSRWKELSLGKLKIDHFDSSTNTIREVKKSPKLEHAHQAQIKYYMYALEQRGVHNVSGLLEYPKQRKTLSVVLTDADRQEIQQWEAEVARIIALPICPEVLKKPYCKSCAFYDFCFV